MLGKTELNLRLVFNILGLLLCIESLFMLVSFPFSFLQGGDASWELIYSFLITAGSGGILWSFTRLEKRDIINLREGFAVVSFTWLFMALFGTLPFLLSGTIPSFTDAFFETMSGFTTTGSSVLTDIEALPKGILFWRSMTHWIGGMGIIVLTVAILPLLGIGGFQLYAAEMPGVTKEKLHPRITGTAKRLWAIYIMLTLAETAFLMFGGMDLFDGLCHSFATMATGGFSTKNTSIAGFSPYIQYVITVFMFLAGTNFTLHYFALHGRFREVWKSEEFRKYLGLVLLFTLVITAVKVFQSYQEAGTAFRAAIFQVVSIITTTGFVTSDYLLWPSSLWFLIFLLMFVGGMAGSTGGGIKVVRQVLLVKNASLELKRTIHPNAIIPVRLNGKPLPQETIFKVMAFFQIYILVFVIGAMVLSLLGMDFETAIGASIASIGNIGPGLGSVGPVGNYAHIPVFGKWILALLMMMGRLELFTVLILFTPAFWRR
jgi:trk system potassium uptake protein TrkH